MTNTPKLRFKEFSGEWKSKKFKDIVWINQGLQIAISDRYLEDGENRFFYITNEFLNKNSDKKYYIENPPSNVICKKTDILMTRTGNTGRVITGVSGAFHNNFFKINYDTKQHNQMFLYHVLTSFKVQKNITRLAGTSTIPDLNHGDFYNIKISYPTLEEQEKIASFFSLIDKKIELQTEKVEELKNYKKGIMQKIFSQELRFKDENGNEYPEWEISTIEKIANLEKGFTPDTKDEEGWIGDIPWLSIADMKQGKYVANVSKYISNKALGKKHLVPTGTLIMSFKLTIGRLAIVEEPLMTNEAICHFYWKNSNINTEYMYYYLNSVNVESFGCRAAKGITLNNDSLNSIVVKIPVIQEQKKISELLMSVDKKIEKEQEKLERLKQYKQGLLRQMFI